MQVHNLDTKLPCPGYEIKHGTRGYDRMNAQSDSIIPSFLVTTATANFLSEDAR